jgi:hypothetical protein
MEEETSLEKNFRWWVKHNNYKMIIMEDKSIWWMNEYSTLSDQELFELFIVS